MAIGYPTENAFLNYAQASINWNKLVDCQSALRVGAASYRSLAVARQGFGFRL